MFMKLPMRSEIGEARETPFVDTATVKKMAKDALGFTSDIINRHGPRLTGTQACLDAADSINEALSNFLNEIGEEEYQFVSDKHIMFMDEYNDDKLQEILEEVYDNLIEELEELEE